jgi:hypothetical protein
MGRTACTEPQCLYKGALYLLPFIFYNRLVTEWNVQMVTNTFRVYRVQIQVKRAYCDGGHRGVTQSPQFILQHGCCISNFSNTLFTNNPALT